VANRNKANKSTEPVLIASNWAVGTWCVASCVHYQVCQYYRGKEKDGMRQARELMEKKRATMEARKEARRKAREEQMRIEEEQRRGEARRKTWSYWIDKNVRFW
jgi:cytochrome c oxidase assembly protein subunit 20